MGARCDRPKVLYVELAPEDSRALALLESRLARRGTRLTRSGIVRALLRRAADPHADSFEIEVA
jgi:hypothetical protein